MSKYTEALFAIVAHDNTVSKTQSINDVINEITAAFDELKSRDGSVFTHDPSTPENAAESDSYHIIRTSVGTYYIRPEWAGLKAEGKVEPVGFYDSHYNKYPVSTAVNIDAFHRAFDLGQLSATRDERQMPGAPPMALVA
ncbi:MAG TPA: hypothetical protein VGM36_13230 [Rhizomicrobium sp.]|jgi:hypothetical protein